MRLVAVALVLATLLPGCSDGDAADGPTFETPPQDGDDRYVITLTRDRTFSPGHAEVPVNARVVFEAELEGCDVRSSLAGGPDSRQSQYGNGLLPAGGEYGWWAPSEPAEYSLSCTLHEENGMVGVLRVA